MTKKNFQDFLIILINFIIILGLLMSIVKKKCWDLDVKIIDPNTFTDVHINVTDRHQYLHYTL